MAAGARRAPRDVAGPGRGSVCQGAGAAAAAGDATAEDATSVLPVALQDVTLEGGTLSAVLPPVSWAMVRVATR